MNLSDRALLVQLSISQWTARKLDKGVTEQVAAQHNASKYAGRYNKSLLPMNDYLDDVSRKAGYIRNKFYDNTLPWGLEGTQMLPSDNYLAFMTEFRKEKSEWEQIVKKFIDNYEDLIDHAKFSLGDLFNPADYPSKDEIAKKFKMDMAVFPVPSNDFRVQIASEELTSIQKDVERRVREAQQSAMKDVWDRLYDKVQKIVEKLADPTAKFRDSLIENARETCDLLTRLNFTDDPDLEAMRRAVEDKLLVDPDNLRADLNYRKTKADEAKDIMDKMAVFMGAK